VRQPKYFLGAAFLASSLKSEMAKYVFIAEFWMMESILHRFRAWIRMATSDAKHTPVPSAAGAGSAAITFNSDDRPPLFDQ
jgi:hypothetical protein